MSVCVCFRWVSARPCEERSSRQVKMSDGEEDRLKERKRETEICDISDEDDDDEEKLWGESAR